MNTETDTQLMMKSWWIPVVIGGLTLATGIFIIAYPDISLNLLAIVTGINMVLVGGTAVLATFGDDEKGHKTLLVVVGVLTIIAGIIVMRRPEGAVLIVVLAIGMWLVLAGVVDFAQGLAAPGHRMTHFAGGAAKLVIGIVILAVPDQSVSTLAVLAGIGFAISGLVSIATGLALRAVAGDPRAPSPAT